MADRYVEAINLYFGTSHETLCESCGVADYSKAFYGLQSKVDQFRIEATDLLSAIPIASLHSPIHWDYDVLTIVTAQSTTGTGVISEIASGWTDFFGLQSGVYNRKIRNGEDLCKAALRVAAMEAGGNAVIGCDIDYAEVGGVSSMLMVCMTGTAVRLKNVEILGQDFADKLTRFKDVNEQLQRIETMLKNQSLRIVPT